MTTEELLKPRWKVIADFPGSWKTNIEVGDILIPSEEIDQPETCYVASYYVELTLFPHLFKRLNWWEYILPKDRPQYIRGKKTKKVFKVIQYYPDAVLIEHTRFIQHLNDFEPATEQEYLNQFNNER